uniref:LAGLIDADG homing endonuclease n=1 Tax=Fuscoporia gilva TaxID=40471 RepID=UPI0023D7CBEE|nr:LAGLIDADG homing endonuclease [Fuscoporia gilva]WDD39647.1 LAGLIDADG homing endonuclease [Fuscoporia gilva]
MKRNLQLSSSYFNNTNRLDSIFDDKDICKLIEKFVGILDGDGYFDIGPQKQYNKNTNNKPKSTIRIRLGINLQFKDKDLLNLIVNKLGVGKIDYSKTKNQYRLIIYKKDILNIIYPYLNFKNINFLSYNRRKQFFLFKYIIENNIKHWENLNLQEIDNLFNSVNKNLDFSEIIKLPYFYNWLVGFTVAEGSFHIKSKGTAHFSIVQSGIENYHLIKAIHYFIKGKESFNHQIKPENSNVYRISFSSKKDLNFIVNFFENNKLLGLKNLQFENWKQIITNINKIKTISNSISYNNKNSNNDNNDINNNNNARNVEMTKLKTNITETINSNTNKVCNQ